MNQANKYLRVATKALLLAGYLFLFANQFNSRFYSVANFVEYREGRQLATAQGHISGPGKVLSVPDKTHLGLDKRYSMKNFVKLPFTDFSLVPAAETVARIYFVPLKRFSASLLPTNALRGPPCA